MPASFALLMQKSQKQFAVDERRGKILLKLAPMTLLSGPWRSDSHMMPSMSLFVTQSATIELRNARAFGLLKHVVGPGLPYKSTSAMELKFGMSAGL